MMKHKKIEHKKQFLRMSVFISLILVLSLNSFYIINNNFSNSKEVIENNIDIKTSIPSGIISIVGDEGWQQFKDDGFCMGNGTLIDPYVIKNKEIDGLGTSDYGISIQGSRVYFIIENCTLYNAYYGICLYGVGNATLRNNTCYNNIDGIFIYNSENSTISNCTLFDNQNCGIQIHSSINITIQNNSITNSFWGIYIYVRCQSCTITGNKMVKCGLKVNVVLIYDDPIGLILADPNFYDHKISADNYVNGKHLYFYKNKNNLDYNNFSNAGQIILYNCNNSIIKDLNLSFTSIGIELLASHSCKLNNIIANNDTHAGISILGGSNNTITNNNVSHNDQGIIIISSSYNSISNNIIINNQKGLAIENIYGQCCVHGSAYNNISQNVIENNSLYGIYLFWSDYNKIKSNEIAFNENGIYLDISYDTIISSNIIYNNSGNGIHLYCSKNNLISENIIWYNYIGIFLEYSENNYVVLNSIDYNHQDFLILHEYVPIPFPILFIFVLLIIILLVGLSSSLVSITIYKNFSGRRINLISKEINKKKDLNEKIQIFKSSKDIINEITNKELLLELFNPISKHGIDLEILSEDTFLSAMSEEFLEKLDKLSLNENDKKEFLREMSSIKPSERLDIINSMFIKSGIKK